MHSDSYYATNKSNVNANETNLADNILRVVHTHSPFATSFAVRGESIYTTTANAVFGGEIPVSDFVTNGEEEIGREIVEKIGDDHAILLRSHGIFTIGESPEKTLKYAIILEETAEVVYFALLRGGLEPLHNDVVKRGYEIYKKSYGQG